MKVLLKRSDVVGEAEALQCVQDVVWLDLSWKFVLSKDRKFVRIGPRFRTGARCVGFVVPMGMLRGWE